jgi:predicted dienelactone hydrolase
VRILPLASVALGATLLWPLAADAKCPADSATAAFLAPGSYAVGERTLTLVDTSRAAPAHGSVAESPSRTLVTEVWYPIETGASDPTAPVARGGKFPLVFDSPGLLDFRLDHEYYTRALASRGYVVASTDFPETGIGSLGNVNLGDLQHQPGDISFVIDSLLALSKTKGSWLAGGIDRHRIGVSGLSLGGLTTLLVTYHPTLRDPRVRASLAIAPVACAFEAAFYRAAKPPLLLLQGDQDLIVPLAGNGARAFENSNSPRELVKLVHGTHTAFSGGIQSPSATSYDLPVCSLVIANTQGNAAEGLGGSENGIDPALCAELLTCQPPGPPNPPMAAARQHAVTTAVVTAFFEAHFRHSKAGRCFLKSGLATLADVQIETAPGRRLPRGK